MKNEEWRPVEGWETYEVSNLGRVRSYHNNRHGVSSSPRYLKTDKPTTGDRYCLLNLRHEGNKRKVRLHQLVAEVWLPKPQDPKKNQVLHRDDNPLNNTVENLYWGNFNNNINDQIRNGVWNNQHTKRETVAVL